jgi:hypothetical protein
MCLTGLICRISAEITGKPAGMTNLLKGQPGKLMCGLLETLKSHVATAAERRNMGAE